ncbi:hypothetical protein SeMB42_g03489 [Synchytrium endobioticum]|uniref:Uncharacterized protein n=1 Tax=Synchytrium endobioticum TaxID=286115 RepID=A0A507D6D1_9FUNG|nr:hypothetical protein SeMB42_g03489 [Synchytrium endobioticum]
MAVNDAMAGGWKVRFGSNALQRFVLVAKTKEEKHIRNLLQHHLSTPCSMRVANMSILHTLMIAVALCCMNGPTSKGSL